MFYSYTRICTEKQVDRVHNAHLDKGLKTIGFVQFNANECVYTKDSAIFMVYVDNIILISKTDSVIDKTITQLSTLYKLTNKG